MITNNNKGRMIAMEMRFLRKIEGITRRDSVKNTEITTKLEVTLVNEIVEEKQVGWLGQSTEWKKAE